LFQIKSLEEEDDPGETIYFGGILFFWALDLETTQKEDPPRIEQSFDQFVNLPSFSKFLSKMGVDLQYTHHRKWVQIYLHPSSIEI